MDGTLVVCDAYQSEVLVLVGMPNNEATKQLARTIFHHGIEIESVTFYLGDVWEWEVSKAFGYS